MTRGEIILYAQDTLGESMGTQEGANPGAWNRLVTTAADEVARASWCHYTTASAPLTAYQAQYCAPAIFELQAASVFYADGTRHTLSMATFAAMDDQWAGWRDSQPGNPTTLVASGLNQFVLYPVPSYSSVVFVYTDLSLGANASQVTSSARPFMLSDIGLQLQVSGGMGFTTGPYYISDVVDGVAVTSNARGGSPIGAGASLSTSGSGTLTSGGLVLEGWGTTTSTPGLPGDWSASDARCPLPERAHMAVVYKACLLRIIRNPTQENITRQSAIAEEYKSELGRLQAEVKRWTHATREPAYLGGGGAYHGSNPLDW